MKSRLILSVFVLLMLAQLAAAIPTGKVAYIVRNTALAKPAVINTLNEMGFEVQLLKNTELAGVNWDNYLFIIVNDELFPNPADIPVNTRKALILNTWNLNDFHWSRRGSTYASSQPIVLLNQFPDHIITRGFPSSITVYTQAKVGSVSLAVNYLYRFDKAPAIKSIVSIPYNAADAVIATADAGTMLRDGYRAAEKGVFFGIAEGSYWTQDAKTLFKNSVIWLLTDTNPPVITEVKADSIQETTARITWKTNTDSTSVVEYGLSPSLGETYSDEGLVKIHEAFLSGLEPKSTHYFRVKSCNAFGYCASSGIFNFTTLDLTPPEVVSMEAYDIGDSSAKISLELNEESNATLRYGTSATNMPYSITSGTFTLKHQFSITGLSDKTTYYYKVLACDKVGLCSESWVDSFTTTDITPPAPPLTLEASVINSNRNVRLNWTRSPDTDAVYYNIYISETPDGFEFSAPFATTTQLYWVDSSAGSVSRRFYLVRAEDGHGNEGEPSIIVGKFDIPLRAGINLVSLPLEPFSQSISRVMHQDSNFHPVTEVKRLGSAGYQSARFNPSTATWSGAFNQMNHLEGYFLNSSTTYTFTHVGKLPSSPQQLPLRAGLNMVGYASLYERGLETLPLFVDEVFRLGEDGVYSIATLYEGKPWWFCSDEFGLVPGVGYIFKAKEGGVWQYEP